jgi:hypothetical protein
MRELKFRVWDDRLNLFNYFDLTNVMGHLPMDCLDNVQQFTGVIDPYGNEIYEGDIVWLESAHIDEDEKNRNRFEIVFHRGAFQVKPIFLSKPQGFGIGGGNHQFTHMVEIIGHDEEDMPIYNYVLPPARPLSDFNICVVMGNIFKNPELLKN